MGFSITWCAVREEAADQFLKDLELSATGEVEEGPESSISMARLDTGWRVIWCNDEVPCSFLRPEDLAVLSKSRDVLLFMVSEYMMASSLEMWSSGKRAWWISHESEKGPRHLDVDGDLPECFPKIRDEMEKAQRSEDADTEEVDYIFNIPVMVAQQLVGFKYDEDSPHLVNNEFAVLSRPTPPKKSLFRRLLGK
ncbi:MAG: hypothetical protein H6752_13050 [Candidatus Omnitrophica bacterium]|nr:hypothetical protein [Candidatus Omnitrophota bacterium]